MGVIDRAEIVRYHRDRSRTFGADSVRALGWKSSKNQLARFEALADIADLSGCSVLDVGCGHGDLSAFLDTRFRDIDYIGIDQSDEFLGIATERFGDRGDAKFLMGDFWSCELPQVDYVLASGALNYRHSDDDFVQKMISKLFGCCRRGLGFNLLSEVDIPGSLLVEYQPEVVVSYCRQLTQDVGLRQGYLHGDYTVFAYGADARRS